MIRIILRKEIAYHITTPRVFVFLAISTSLFIINGLTFVGSYKPEVEAYSERHIEIRSTTGTSVAVKPNPMWFCVEGNSRIRPRVLHINLDDTIHSGRPSQYENFKLPYVRRIDWSFIIQTVYALFCAVLTFDAVSGERARGTLKLMASNSVSRAQILLAKYLAVLIITFTVLLIGGLLSLAIINLLSVSVPGKDDIMPLIFFVILSILYISLFISMSLLASCLARTSATALLSLLLIVIMLVFVVPNMAGILAGKLVDAPSDYETRAEYDAIGAEYVKRSRDMHERIRNGTLRDKDEITELYHGDFLRMVKERSKLNKEYERGLMKRQKMAETLALISPSAAFQASGESIANAGAYLQKRLREAAELYQDIYLDYVKSKMGEIIPGWRPPANFQLPDKTMINIPEVKPKQYDGDMSDFPVFPYPRPPTQERLRDSLFGMVLLMLWNIVCFMGAHIVFVKQDIK